MITANYDFNSTAPGSAKARTRSKYRPPIAYVYGAVRGVPFRNAVKTEAALERAMRFGYDVVRV